ADPGMVVHFFKPVRHTVNRPSVLPSRYLISSLASVCPRSIGRHLDIRVDARVQALDAAQVLVGQLARRHGARLNKGRGLGEAEMADVSCLHSYPRPRLWLRLRRCSRYAAGSPLPRRMSNRRLRMTGYARRGCGRAYRAYQTRSAGGPRRVADAADGLPRRADGGSRAWLRRAP